MGTNEVTFGTGTLAVGDRTFTVVGDLTGWVPGDDVFCFFGSDPGDPNEWYVKYFDIVESVVGQVVTLRVGVSEAIPNPFTFSNRIIKPASICQNCQIGNFATDMTPGIIQNITGNVIFGRNVVVRDIFIRSSNGPVGQSNCENVEFRNIYARHVDRNAHSAAGGVISFNGCRNASARNIFAEDIERFAVYLETQCRGVLIENLHISYGSDASPGAGSDAMISIGGGCTGVVVRRGTFTSTVQDKQVVSYFGTSSLLARTEDFTLAGPRVLAMSLGTHFGYFEHGGIKRERRTWSNTIRYVAGQNVSFSNLPVGMLAAIRVYSSTAFLASQAFLQDTATFNGINITALFSPPAQTNGQEVFNTAQVNGTDTHRLDVLFDAGLAAGGYATIEIDYFARLDSFDNGSQALKQRTDYSPTGAVRLGGHTVMYGTAVPVAAQGSFSVGDRVFNATAAVGSPKGWICTVAGTPGTWVSEGNL
jgi:hypothetical protein